jgi:uncharacterized membrane protein
MSNRMLSKKMRRSLCGLVVAGLSLFLIACPGFGENSIEDLAPDDEVSHSWDSDVKQILESKCGSCHSSPNSNGAPATFRLDRYDRDDADGLVDGAYEKRLRIEARALTDSTMPPAGSASLTDAEKSTLSAWLGDGAPKSSTELTWNGGIGAIISSKCGSCHSASPSTGVPTTFRLDVYNREDSGNTSDGAFEKLLRIKARALDDKTMPPTGVLPVDEQVKIQEWIANGAPLQ